MRRKGEEKERLRKMGDREAEEEIEIERGSLE